MVIGLSACSEGCATREGRSVMIAPTAEFEAAFRERFGSLDCPDVIGCDLRDPDAMRKASEDGLFDTRCAPAVQFAAKTLSRQLESS